jgi:geranylgeranyl pyrophosphate synthase
MIGARVREYQARIERVLDAYLPTAEQIPERLHAAQRYSVLGGGKRLRPVLVYCTGEALGLDAETLDAPAAAVELIHAYSLVHDDLPAMDDDDLRRGQPTTHRAFDEATAILVGDALQVAAFSLLARESNANITSSARLQMVRILADASGTAGMAGGQALDLAAVGRSLSLEELEAMHRLKTGALIRASVMIAAAAVPQLADRGARCARRLRTGHRACVSDSGRHSRRRGQHPGSRQNHRSRRRQGQTDVCEPAGAPRRESSARKRSRIEPANA